MDRNTFEYFLRQVKSEQEKGAAITGMYAAALELLKQNIEICLGCFVKKS